MILKKCPQCSYENPETAKYCNQCGAKFVTEESPPPAPQEPVQASSEPMLSEATLKEPVSSPVGASPETLKVEPIVPAASTQPEPVAPPEATGTPIVIAAEPKTPEGTSREPLPTEAETTPEAYPAEESSSQGPFGARFKILGELGSGSLGMVYKVFDKAMEREQALKTIKPEISQKAEAFEGFARELKAERGIVHKNIARIFELNVLKGTPFITMEYIAGKGLRSLLREKKRLSIVEAVSIAGQLFSGLAHAHQVGALHLDLRPENVMIDKEGTVKIMDLGIARLCRAKGIIRSVAGMPQYMSPEQLEGRETDACSDIFAGGVMVYEMLTGNLPPVGEMARSPRDLNPSVPQQLSLLVLRCIEQEKAKRYQTAQEIRAELEVIETAASQMPAQAGVQLPAERQVEPKPDKEPAPPAAVEPEKAPRPARIHKRTRRQRVLPLPRKMRLPTVAMAALVVLAVILWLLVFSPPKSGPPLSSQPPQLSLAVLPFEDLSPLKERQHLGFSLADALIGSLGKMDKLFIPDADSSSSLQGKVREFRLVGRRLHVDHYLEGTFEAQDDRIRVEARLLRTDSGTPIWSAQYERSTAEIPDLQEEIARAVSQSLGLEAPPDSGSTLHVAGPANFEAYDFYAQARFLARKKGKNNLEKAVDLFTRAGEKDPAFAPAFGGLADAYLFLAEGNDWKPDRANAKAKDAALKALMLDSGLAEAHAALARIKKDYEWDFPGAEKEFREALRLDPDNAAAHQFYALLLSALGRHGEAIKESQSAQTQNPLSSEVNAQAGRVLYFARLYEDAAAEVKKALATDPLYPGHYLNAALIQIQMGQLDEAGRSLKEAEDLGSDPLEVKLLRGYIYAREGQRQEVGRILTEVFNAAKQAYVSEVTLAVVYAGINEKDQAVACLENAFASRDPSLIYIRAHPFLDSVRGDARFIGLLKKIGLGSS